MLSDEIMYNKGIHFTGESRRGGHDYNKTQFRVGFSEDLGRTSGSTVRVRGGG